MSDTTVIVRGKTYRLPQLVADVVGDVAAIRARRSGLAAAGVDVTAIDEAITWLVDDVSRNGYTFYTLTDKGRQVMGF
jgi:hypothetical protein